MLAIVREIPMSARNKLSFYFVAAAVALVGTAAHSGERRFMGRGDAVQAPPGFLDLCQREQGMCPQAIGAPPEAAPSLTRGLFTASLGGGGPFSSRPPAIAAAPAPDSAPPLLQIEQLEAYRPTIEADFALVGAPRLTPATPSPLLDKGQLALINAVNRAVNREVRKASDFDLYGLLEFWSLPRVIDGKMYGDCEDYALEKRRRLIAAGVPAAALSMAVATTARGEGHAVLVVSMESGDWVLDNLTPWATPWEDLNYHWLQRQVAGTDLWTTVS